MSQNDDQPSEIEVKDFFYKQMRKLRVFKSPQDLITARSSLLAVSNQYGIVYVAGEKNCVKAIKVETVEKLFIEVQGSLQVEEETFPSVDVEVGFPFSHLAISCDELTLAICFESNGACLLGFLDVRAFFSSKSPKKLFAALDVFSGNPGIKVRQILWNPTSADTIAVLLTNGQIKMVKLNGVQASVAATLQGTATAVSWSPKGKQIVAGLKDGSLVQLTPDLQKKKEIPTPTMLQNPSQVSDLVWISTYQFGVVYTELDDDDVSLFIVVNSPKAGPPSYQVFDDVYYGMGEDREGCFYLNHLTEWKLMLSIYSCSYEVVTVKQTETGSWVKWVLPDSGLAVLPTTHDNDETYPLGLAVTFAVTKPIEQDDQKFPPVPILFLLTTNGVLCPFYVMYKNPKEARQICRPPEPLAVDGERLATSASIGAQKPAVSQDTKTVPPPTVLPSTVPSTAAPPPAALPTTAPASKIITGLTNPPASNMTPFTTSKPPMFLGNTKGPSTGPTPPTGNPSTTTPPSFGLSKSFGANLSGLSTNPGTFSIPQLNFSTGTKPEQSGMFQFRATPPVSTSQSGSALGSAQPKSSLFNFQPTIASTPTQLGLGGAATAKSSEPIASMKTAPFASPVVGATPKALEEGDATTVKATAMDNVKLSTTTGLNFSSSTGIYPPFASNFKTSSTTPSTTNFKSPPTTTNVNTSAPTNVKPPATTNEKPSATTILKYPPTSSVVPPATTLVNPSPVMRVPPNEGATVPVKKDGTIPVKKDGTIPVKKDGTIPVKKDGTIPSKEHPKTKLPQKVSPSKQEQLEAAMHQNIQDEVEAFNKEMEKARNRYNDLRKLDAILKELNTREISKEVNSHRRFMNQVKSTAESLDEDVNRTKNSLIHAFELAEDARIRDNTAIDPHYLKLLKNRGLDPSSERKMKEIRSSYLLLDNTLREVNMALDEQWDKQHKKNRSMESPCLDKIYQTMRQHQNIVKNQSLQLEAISKRVNCSVRTTRWGKKRDSKTESNDELSLSDRLRKQKLDPSTKEADNVAARKKSELRQILSQRSNVPVIKTSFISDWRSRRDSSSGSVESESSSEPEETSEKDEKPPMKESEESKRFSETKFTASKASASTEQRKPLVHSTPKFENGANRFSASTDVKPSFPFGFSERKTVPLKTDVPKENITGQSYKKDPLQQVNVPPSKVAQATGSDKPGLGVSPRDAAAAAALARASVGLNKPDLGASIPAKTLVEHKAERGAGNVSTKDPNADHHARIIADAAVKDAEDKMKNVTQTPPTNTASTFTVRSSSSNAAQSSGPPVMVLQPGGGFAFRKPGESSTPAAGKPGLPPGKVGFPVSKPATQQETERQTGSPSSGASAPEKGATTQSAGFSFRPSLGNNSFGSQLVFGGASAGISSGGAPVFGNGSTMFGNKGPLSFGIGSKTPQAPTVVQSPSREEGAGGRKEDGADKKSSPLSTQTAPSGGGKDNVARTLFDQADIDESEDVLVRGEPEGESKQPVAIAPRQAAIGKSEKDIPTATTVSAATKTQTPPTTSSPGSTTVVKPFMAGFKSPFSGSPIVIGSSDTKPSLGFAPVSTPPVSKATTEPSPSTNVPPKAQSESQPTQRLQALGSGLTLTPPPFSGGFDSSTSVSNPPSQNTTPPLKETTLVQSSIPSSTTTSISKTTTNVNPGLATTGATNATPSIFTTQTFTTPTKPMFGATETQRPVETAKNDLKSTTESGGPPEESTIKSTSTLDISKAATTALPDTALQPAQPASSAAPLSFGSGFGAPVPTSAPPVFGISAFGSTAQTLQGTQSKPDASGSILTSGFGSTTPSGSSQNTGFGAGNISTPAETKPASGFGGFSGLGGKPIEPNRNPFQVGPSSQTTDSGLFGNATSSPNPFQSSPSRPLFGPAPAGSTGVGSTGFASPAAPAPTFGSAPTFGANPTFGGNPTFGSPTFGAAPSFGAPPAFGSPPSFGSAPTFGSGVGGTTFGGAPSFGNTDSSPSRIFGSGTEAAGMFGNSPSNQTFGSLSSQSVMQSFGSLAGGQNTGMNQGQGFGSSMSGSQFSSYR